MDTELHFCSTLTVAKLLATSREVIPVFIRHRMACVGCPLAAFEQLESAALHYGLEPDAFIAEVCGAISPAVPDAHLDSGGIQ